MGVAERGDWIQTATGRPFWPIDPRPEDIDIEDIAHALSMLCRFGGHCLRFYSVAEHSVLLSRHVAPEHKLWALLHDASEAYLVDVPRPLKPFLRGYREAEGKIMAAVCDRYGLAPEMPAAVKAADTSLLMDEAAQNMSRPLVAWELKAPPLGVTLEYLDPSEARKAFLCAFENLQG
jgi:hypothetical protein